MSEARDLLTLPDERERREAWLEARRKHITSTDVAALLGVDPKRGPLDVWLAKRGESTVEVSERMEWGNRLQEAILMGYADRTGRIIRLADPYTLVECPDLPILGASLDAQVVDPEPAAGVPVDAKNVGWKRPDLWGEEGTDQIPDSYLVQLSVQMLVTGATTADLAVLFGGNHLEVFVTALDPEGEMRRTILDVVERFWERHVVANVAPPVDGSSAWADRLSKVRQKTDLMLRAGPVEGEAAARLIAVRAALEEAEKAEAEAENLLKAAIGEAGGMTGPGWRVTYHQNRDTEKVDWQGVAIQYGMEIERILGIANKGRKNKIPGVDGRAIVEANTKKTPGARQFRFRATE